MVNTKSMKCPRCSYTGDALELDVFDRGVIAGILSVRMKDTVGNIDRPRELKYRELLEHMSRFKTEKIYILIEKVKK